MKAADACLASGTRGALEALLRQEGIYSSLPSAWRVQLGAHGASGLVARKPGRKPKLDAVSGEQMKAALETVLGRPLEYVEKSFAEIDPLLGRLFGGAGPAIAKNAPRALPPMVDIQTLRASYPEIAWHSFERWAKEQDFSPVSS